ncbi:hypothetical protein [Bartonella queenslandensis]|uniref:hypothetical protein n=1 Tax=Bartonella queenslandensis TaxID=481138 RepID=UPI0002F11302|nr:hypothetical protein [Bartonella queenslandensis]
MGSSSGSRDYCSADNFSSKYDVGAAFGNKHSGQVGLVGGFFRGAEIGRNPASAMSAASFGQAVGNEYGETIGGYVGYGVAGVQCGAQRFGQSIAHSSGGTVIHF